MVLAWHLLLNRADYILIVHKDGSAVRRVERDDFFPLDSLSRNQSAYPSVPRA